MVIGYAATTSTPVAIGCNAVATGNNSIAIGCNAVATGNNSIAIGVSATTGPYLTPVQRLYIDILKRKYRIIKCRRRGNTVAIEIKIDSALDYNHTYKLEPKNDVE
jgi:trimeric autotransporter adhesin